MREPAFWWRPAGLMSGLLSPLAAIYGAVAASRMARAGHDAGIPVICVGNPTLGGAGKTPTAIAVAQMLDAAGRRPFVLSRGYGGALAGPVQVDPAHHRATDVGDEPLLLARFAPTIVSRDRAAGADAARAAGAGAVVMDDGFQSPALRKDRSLLVVDGRRGIGNGKVFPAGPLRAATGAAAPPRASPARCRRRRGRRSGRGGGASARPAGVPRPARAGCAGACRAEGQTGAGVRRHRRPGKILQHAPRRRDRGSRGRPISRPSPLPAHRGARPDPARRARGTCGRHHRKRLGAAFAGRTMSRRWRPSPGRCR